MIVTALAVDRTPPGHRGEVLHIAPPLNPCARDGKLKRISYVARLPKQLKRAGAGWMMNARRGLQT